MNRKVNMRNSCNPGTWAKTRIKFLLILLMVFTMSFFLAGCLPPSGTEKSRTDALEQYETIVRWSEWDGAVGFLAPSYLEEHPISRLQMERLQMFKVTSYTIRAFSVYDEGMTAVQTVDIKMYNSAQAIERTITDEQVWRYDPELKHWLLHSGLPDPTKRK